MYRSPVIILTVSLVIIACTSGAGTYSDLKEIEALDSIQRKAHYEKNAVLLGSIMHDSFYVARNGVISWSNKSQLVKRFTEYFNQTTYLVWENIDRPIVEVTGGLAVVTYHKKTISTSAAHSKIDTTVFAWASVLKNINGKWKITGIITTDDQ